MNIKNKILFAGIGSLALSAISTPLFAASLVPTSATMRPSNGIGKSAQEIMRERIASSTTNRMGSSTLRDRIPGMNGERPGISNDKPGMASSSETRMINAKNNGTQEIDARIQSLNKLSTRIAGLPNISATDKASLEASISSLITTLTNLKTTIENDTSTTTLKNDRTSITQSYRVYALVEPRINIVIAADRIETIANQLTTVVNKVQARLSQNATSSANTSVQSALTDITAKLGDAKIQANAAVAGVVALVSDNGDKTIMASNTKALKDANAKIKLGQQDLIAIRKDIQSILKVLGNEPRNTANASSTNPRYENGRNSSSLPI